MREMQRQIAAWIGSRRRSRLAAVLVAASTAVLAAAPAQASVGYELNASTPSKALGGGIPHGIAVDQVDQRIYVAIVTNEPGSGASGEIARFESNLTAAGTFAAGSGPFYSGVAVNPQTQGFYAAQAALHTPFGTFGTPKMDLFSSSGIAGTPFALSDGGTLPQIATDSAGDVYYPDANTGTVQVFNSAGALQETIGCSGCPGGSFGKPVSVALNSDDDLYVADLNPDRVVKLTSSGGPYSFASVLQSGRGAAAVGIDPSGDEVFVGDMPSGRDYHIVAYTSSGTQFDDFGAGMFTDPTPEFGAILAAQIAVDATTHKLYVGDLGKFYIFDKVTITPPTATIESATPVGQLAATLRATVNARGHATLDCEFEYTDDADFQVHGFGNADSAPCSQAPDGSSNTPVSSKISGLSPLTMYHYQVAVTSNAGSVTSSGNTFETLPVLPSTVTTDPATAIAETDAKLNGKVNPHGGSSSNCHFEYGTSVAYGTSISCLALPEPVSTDVAETRKVLKLTPGTTYHYKLVVTTNAGTVEGDDVEFKTASPPPPPAPETTPPVTTPPPVTAPPPVTQTPTPPRTLRCKKGFQKKKVRGKLKCVKKKRRHAKRHSAQGAGRSR